MVWLLTFCLWLLAAVGSESLIPSAEQHENRTVGSRCRCIPGNSCWPTAEQWHALNTSINGRMLIPTPTAVPCYDGPLFDSNQCEDIRRNYNKQGYLINKPGSMHLFNWEDAGEQRCPLKNDLTPADRCQTGSVPAYGVDAHSVEDIQKAVAFAHEHRVRIVVKSTGHNYLGRSTAPGALMIWMRNFEGEIQTNMTFTASGCDESARHSGPVVTVRGGKTWGEVYTVIENSLNRTYGIVGGFCKDVGATGGYVLGGGHSLLSPAFGLASDNVLEMTVVTADGQLLTANACQNKDLFWALRGGGGGTFGIVTSVTYKLHPLPNGLIAYSIEILNANRTGQLLPQHVEDIFEILARHSSSLDTVGWGGFLAFDPRFGFTLVFLSPADLLNAAAPMEALREELVGFVASKEDLYIGPFATAGTYSQHFGGFQDWLAWIATIPQFKGYSAGARLLLGTRLIPESALTEPRTLARTLVAGAIKNGFSAGVDALMVAGSAVRNQHRSTQESSVSPAWRSTAWVAFLVTSWDAATSEAAITAKKTALNDGLQVWRDIYPDSGVYSNEVWIDEPNWQRASFGSNYDRLLSIKRHVDPRGMFTCTMCVGSEDVELSENCA
ncbi:uncharacterized protein LOC129589597 isoform X2 [Paramacrobiotus metropolitanus]|uniref:uncharacterized protein LOC129589597 isoform X2 n=1 Tax=Paramacrobiotus metropolitanus TaxID=2943436 RepID=UPI0024460665|nr:uncharacterized protein LOC129589597 isoform X2 [Paramacrobiotus metropolitanus]